MMYERSEYVQRCLMMREKDIIACKHCGETFLHWVNTDRGWRLFNVFNSQHNCHVFFSKGRDKIKEEKRIKLELAMTQYERYIQNMNNKNTFDYTPDWDEVAEQTGDQGEMFWDL